MLDCEELPLAQDEESKSFESNLMEEDLTMRSICKDEIDTMIQFSADAGWNPGLNDAECFFDLDPNGIFVALLNNEPIAFITAPKYGEHFGFVGHIVAKKGFRCQELWRKLEQFALEYLKNRNFCMLGLESMNSWSSYKTVTKIFRYEGYLAFDSCDLGSIVRLSSIPFHEIKEYNDKFFYESRSLFYHRWFYQPRSKALGVRRNGKLAGYGVIRKSHVGFKIGPLFADRPGIADSLFVALTSCIHPPEPVIIDIPEHNNAAISMVEGYHMKFTLSQKMSCSKDIPKWPLHHIFGLTSVEIG